MALLNYSTSINAGRTLGEMQAKLIKAGARSLLIDAENGYPTALSFLIRTQFGERGFRLPVKPDAVLRILERQYEAGQIDRRFATPEQARDVAWRIIKDWLEAQLAIVETEMVTLEQVMLPYMTTGKGTQTVYELMVANQLLLPEGRE